MFSTSIAADVWTPTERNETPDTALAASLQEYCNVASRWLGSYQVCVTTIHTAPGVAQMCTAPSYKAVSTTESTRYSDLDMYMALVSTWYTPDAHMVTVDIYASVPLWHEDLYPGVKEISVESIELVGDSLLHFGVCCESPASQPGILLKNPNLHTSSSMPKTW
jgi:hypothetical protein